MPERLSKKAADIWEDVGTIVQMNQFSKPRSPELPLLHQWTSREASYAQYFYLTRTLLRNWQEMSNKARELSPAEFRDDINDLKHDVDTLRLTVKSLEQEIVSSRKMINELSKRVLEIRSTKHISTATIAEPYDSYVELASAIDIVRRILVVETTDVTTIWTIIDAPPFEDSLRTPVYEAQLSVLSTLEEHIPLDFYVLNVTELSGDQELNDIIPLHSKLLWER